MNDKERLPEVYKVIGAPGSGKTTRVVGNPELDIKGLFLENADKYPLEDQMLVTYTNAGVDEAADRLYRMTDAPKYKINERVTTIHSRCFQTLGMKRDDVPDHWDKKKFCDVHDLPFGWDDDDDDIMGADQQKGNLLFRIYDWLQNNRKDHSEWRDCPADWGFDEDPELLMDEWDEWKDDNGWVDFGDMIENVVELGYTQLKNLGWGVLFPDEDTTTWEMFEEALEDPERDPDIIRGKGAFIDTKVLYVDEFQDLTRLQYEWYLLQKLACEKVYVGGDDDQCLPGWETVSTPSGDVKIEDISEGDTVHTLVDDEIRTSIVEDKRKKLLSDKSLITVETESGNTFTATEDHNVFARMPSSDEENPNRFLAHLDDDRWYVYLMTDSNKNLRVGMTTNPSSRIKQEKGTGMMILGTYYDELDARLAELSTSLNYGIPTTTFKARYNEVVSHHSDRLYGLLNSDRPDTKGLTDEFNVDIDNLAHYTQSGKTTLNINIRRSTINNSYIFHRLSMNVNTDDEDVLEYVESVDGVGMRSKKSNSAYFSKDSASLEELRSLANEIERTVESETDKTCRVIEYTLPETDNRYARYFKMPLKNVKEGMYLPSSTISNKGESKTRSDRVVSVTHVEEKDVEYVYDIEVERTHNFITNGISVSNCIYEWSGANSDFLLDEEGDFEVLETTYRIPSQIWDVCKGVIEQVDHRQEKEVEPHGDDGEFITYRSPSERQLMEHLREDECMALFRARYQVDEFREHLHKYGIPYRNMSTYDIWDKDLTRIKNALGVLCSGEGKINGDWLDAMIECADPGMVSLKNRMTESEKVMSHFSGVTDDELNKLFPFMEKYSDGKMKADAYVNKSDDLNYYQKEALKGVINNKTWDLDPDRLRIGTIHSSKGKEAETVLLATDTTNTIAENMMEELREQGYMDASSNSITDGERRVYYVGMTRASKKLILAQGVIDPAMSIDINTLLDGEHAPDEWESGQPTLNDSW